jgi:hypothetical protein
MEVDRLQEGKEQEKALEIVADHLLKGIVYSPLLLLEETQGSIRATRAP